MLKIDTVMERKPKAKQLLKQTEASSSNIWKLQEKNNMP